MGAGAMKTSGPEASKHFIDFDNLGSSAFCKRLITTFSCFLFDRLEIALNAREVTNEIFSARDHRRPLQNYS